MATSIYSKLPTLPRFDPATIDSLFSLPLRITNLAQTILIQTPEITETKCLSSHIEILIVDLLSKCEPIHDPHGIYALKYHLLNRTGRAAQAFNALPETAQHFLKEVFYVHYPELSLEGFGIYQLKTLFVGDVLLLDYIHDQLEKKLPFDDVKIEVRSNTHIEVISLKLLQMIFVRIAHEEDPAKFEMLVQGMSLPLKAELFRYLITLENGQKKVATHFEALEILHLEDSLLLKSSEVLSHLFNKERLIVPKEIFHAIFAKVLEEYFVEMKYNQIRFEEWVEYILADCPLRLVEKQNAYKTALHRFYNHPSTEGAYQFTLSVLVLADRASMLEQSITKLKTLSLGIYPTFWKCLESWSATEDPLIRYRCYTAGQILYQSFERPPSILLDLVTLVAEKNAIYFLLGQTRDDPSFQVVYALKLMNAILGETANFEEIFFKLREEISDVEDALLDAMATICAIQDPEKKAKAFKLICTYQYDSPLSPAFIKTIVPALVNISDSVRFLRATRNLHQFSPYAEMWNPQEFILYDLLVFTHPAWSEMELTFTQIRAGMKADYPEISETIWDYYQGWSQIKNPSLRHRAYLTGHELLRSFPPGVVPDYFFKHVVKIIACTRNKDLYNALNAAAYAILKDSDQLKQFGSLIENRTRGKIVMHLVAPMLLLNGADFIERQEIKELLLTKKLRKFLRDHLSGVSQSLQMLATTHCPPVYIKRSLFIDSKEEMNRAFAKLGFLQGLGAIDCLPLEWHMADLEKITIKPWEEKFGIHTDSIPDFQKRFDALILNPRMTGKIEKFISIHQDNPCMMHHISQFLNSVLTQTFDTVRYSTKDHPHLEWIKTHYPVIYEGWQTADIKTSLPSTGTASLVTLKDVQALFENAITQEHMGPFEIPCTLEIARNEVEVLIFQVLNEAPNLEHIKALEGVLNHLPSPPEILNDIQGLIHSMEPANISRSNLFVLDSADPTDLFLCGTEVDMSCQRVDAPAKLSQCLLAYVLDGKNRLIVVIDASGKIVARCIFRLLLDNKGRPALYLEPIYGQRVSEIEQAILDKAKQRARTLGVPLYTSGEAEVLYSKSSSMPYEYSDTSLGNGVTDGRYEIRVNKLY